jgi:hypothetical protein
VIGSPGIRSACGYEDRRIWICHSESQFELIISVEERVHLVEGLWLSGV